MANAEQDYIDYYRTQLEKSLEYQDFVMEKLYDIGISLNCYSSIRYQNEKGESRAGIEIKFDDRRKDTGNLYIEYAEKSHPNKKEYVPSGIDRRDNTWLYVQGDYEVIYVIAKTLLKNLKTVKKFKHVANATSRGYLLPDADAQKYAAIIIKC